MSARRPTQEERRAVRAWLAGLPAADRKEAAAAAKEALATTTTTKRRDDAAADNDCNECEDTR